MEATGIWDSRNNRHATVEHETLKPCPFCGGARTNALNKLHDKIAGLRFLDPACGSGNFLTETYLELRRIENRILADLDKDGQLAPRSGRRPEPGQGQHQPLPRH